MTIGILVMKQLLQQYIDIDSIMLKIKNLCIWKMEYWRSWFKY